ncbi:MAG: PAS domain S-box protein [Syntrophales bacterium]|nr:PAS domain S-box protein [Syntrophales bacterium]
MNARRGSTRDEGFILIVEDSTTQAVMLEALLSDEGYKVTVASDGLEALECLKERKPLLVISDIVMPNMDGYELCRTIKTDPLLKDIPVMLLTALKEPVELVNGLKSGADNFINKPYKDEFLLSQVSRILANRELRRERYFDLGIEILFAGEKHYITSDRVQIVDLLLSTFENAVSKNQALGETINQLYLAEADLRRANESLEEKVRERTEQLSHLNDVLKAVRSINRLIVREREPERLIQEACDTMVQTRGYDEAWIILVDPETGKRITAAAESLDRKDSIPLISHLRDGMLPPCTELAKQRSGSVVILNAHSPDCLGCPYDYPGKTGTMLTTDIRYGKRLKGFISLHISSSTKVDEEEVRLILEVAGDIGFAIHDINLERSHSKTFEDLNNSESLYRLHFENINDIIFSVDQDCRVTSISPSVKSVLGYSPEEIIGRKFGDLPFVTDLSTDAISSTMQRVFAGAHSSHPSVFELVARDGTSRFLDILSSPIITDTEVTAVLSVGRDITERKVAEGWLLKQRTMTECIMQTTPSGVMMVDKEGRITLINTGGCDILGVPRDVLDGHNNLMWKLEMTDHDGNKISKERVPSSLIFKTGHPIHGFDAAIQTPAGKRLFLTINGAPLLDEEGAVREVVLTFDDITERIETGKELHHTLESLQRAFIASIQVMVTTVEIRDPYTAGHQNRCAGIACAIAKEMGLSPDQIDSVRMAGTIHDVGKVSIPAEILAKPAKLTEIEFALIKEHPKKGYDILKHVEFPWPLAEIIHQHHERMDGSGYPRHLKGDEIIMEARILAVADVVEAMSSHRPYRPALGANAAMDEIEKNKGIFYDADVVDACLRLFWKKGFEIT